MERFRIVSAAVMYGEIWAFGIEKNVLGKAKENSGH